MHETKQIIFVCIYIVIEFYYSTIAPFYHIKAKERAKYATLLHCRTGQKYGLKAERQNGRTKLYFISGIINPLFDGLTNNTSGSFVEKTNTVFKCQCANLGHCKYEETNIENQTETC